MFTLCLHALSHDPARHCQSIRTFSSNLDVAFFFFFVWLQQTLVISWCLCQRGNLCASSVLGVLEFPWGPTWEAVGSFVCSGPHSPKGQRCGLGIRCLSTTAGGCFSSHQGPTFLYGLGFLIKSTHRKGPLAWVFCKKMGTINGLI